MYGNPLGIETHRESESLANLLDSLEIAEEAARQLALHRKQTKWVIVANQLGTLRNLCSCLAQR